MLIGVMPNEAIEIERAKKIARLSSLKDSKEFLDGDKKVVQEVKELREELKALELASLTPYERAERLIEERSAPTEEELWGTQGQARI